MTFRNILRLVAIWLVFITGSGRLLAQTSDPIISYLTGTDKGTQFNLMDLNTGEIRKIDLGIEPIYGYDWSPDGKQIALDDGHDVYVVSADGSGLQPLTHSTAQVVYTAPAWSPDGTQIGLVEWTDGQARLAVMNSDGSNFRRLMAQADIVRGPLKWSPDGKYLAANSVASVVLESFVIDVPVCLQTPDQCRDSGITLSGAISDWSPNGRRMLVSTNGKFSSSLSINEIAVQLADATCQKQPLVPCAAGLSLTLNTHWVKGAVNTVYPYDSDGHWSADGNQIVFVSNRTGTAQVYVIDADGSHLRQLTHDSLAYAPRWQPA